MNRETMRCTHLFACAGAIAMASASVAQGIITYSWTVGDTGDNDGLVEPGEDAVLRLWGEMDPAAVGFAGSIFDIAGDSDWQQGTIVSYDNFLDALTDDGTLGGDNSITNIEAFQLPPLFNPNFDASNPIALYEIVWHPYDGWNGQIVEGSTVNHLNHDVYVDDFGTSEPYEAVVSGFFFGIPAPSTASLLAIGCAAWLRKRR